MRTDACFADRWVWMRAFGVSVRASANADEVFARLAELALPHSDVVELGGPAPPAALGPVRPVPSVRIRVAGRCRCGTAHRRTTVEVGGATVPVDHDLDTVVAIARGRMKLLVAERSPRLVFVHAGAVAVGGRAVVIPGRSFSGKTTLVAALLERGAEYLSDDYAVFDAEGLVHPFAQRLGMRAPGRASQADVGPERFRAAVSPPVPVGAVIVTRYLAGSTFEPEPVSRATGVAELMAHAVAGRRAPSRVLQGISTAVRGALVWRGDRGDAADAADRVISAAATWGFVDTGLPT